MLHLLIFAQLIRGIHLGFLPSLWNRFHFSFYLQRHVILKIRYFKKIKSRQYHLDKNLGYGCLTYYCFIVHRKNNFSNFAKQLAKNCYYNRLKKCKLLRKLNHRFLHPLCSGSRVFWKSQKIFIRRRWSLKHLGLWQILH